MQGPVPFASRTEDGPVELIEPVLYVGNTRYRHRKRYAHYIFLRRHARFQISGDGVFNSEPLSEGRILGESNSDEASFVVFSQVPA